MLTFLSKMSNQLLCRLLIRPTRNKKSPKGACFFDLLIKQINCAIIEAST